MYKQSLAAIASLAWTVPAGAGEHCIASHYGVGDGYGGRRTANGERMNPRAMTAAHRTLPFGTGRARHASVGPLGGRAHQRSRSVRAGRCIEILWGVARALGMTGIAAVIVESVR
jgi:rare lipoprotein A